MTVRHSSYDVSCQVCRKNAGEQYCSETLWEDDLWTVRHADAPYGVAGWIKLYSKRHVTSPAQFDDEEASSFGPTLRQLMATLEDVTGAPLIYTVALSELWPHYHCHLVPRYAETPNNIASFELFDLMRRARNGEFVVDPNEVDRITGALKQRLSVRL